MWKQRICGNKLWWYEWWIESESRQKRKSTSCLNKACRNWRWLFSKGQRESSRDPGGQKLLMPPHQTPSRTPPCKRGCLPDTDAASLDFLSCCIFFYFCLNTTYFSALVCPLPKKKTWHLNFHNKLCFLINPYRLTHIRCVINSYWQ